MQNRIVEPKQLREAVAYQAEAVVSQVLFKDASGTVTAFAFAEGEGLTEHSNPNDAIVLVLEGGVRITIEGRAFDLAEGDMLHLPPDKPHALHGGGPFKMLLTIFKRAPAPDATAP